MADDQLNREDDGPHEAVPPKDHAGTGIPDAAEGTPMISGATPDEGAAPLADLPQADFWDALYGRRSIRKFKSDAVPRELVDQVMHAGIWAPSSCNYQMWDLVAVDDAAVNDRLGQLSLQLANAPVNIVVSYGRNFSEENWANIQSASALIQNMSLAAQVLGLGTFWITQMGDREKLREIVGLPRDRLVIAVLALGYPKAAPKAGPKRRPLTQVTHYNHYAGRAIPSSVNPEEWEPDLLAIYQRARVLNGLRHNKPRAWETRALETALDQLLPQKDVVGARWLDVLPCTGILTDRICRLRPSYTVDVVERTSEVAEFVANRTRPRGTAYVWESAESSPPNATYDVVSCLFRLEDTTTKERAALLKAIAGWLKPGGLALIGYVSARSFHSWTESMRKRRGGPGGVEYVLAPDPNIGPFQPLSVEALEVDSRQAGLEPRHRIGLQAVPQPEEIEFRTRNFSSRSRSAARLAGRVLSAFERIPGVQSRWGRFQFLTLTRGN